MALPQRNSARAPRIFRLPSLREDGTPGGAIVRRAVTLLLAGFGAILLIALVAGALVTTDVAIDASGIVEPVRVWPVRSQETGTVVEVLVTAGDTVREGQPLVRLDTLQLVSSLAQLRTEAAAARLEYQRAAAARAIEQRQIEERARQAEAARIRAMGALRGRLSDDGLPVNADSVLRHYRVGTRVSIDLAIADVQAAESEIRNNAAEQGTRAVRELELGKQREQIAGLDLQVAALQARLARLVVRAPAAGVVLTEQLDQLRGTLEHEGDLLLAIADPGRWRAALRLSETDVHEVRVGDPVKIEVQAFPRDRDLLRGTVVSVAEEPVSAQGANGAATVYRVVAAIETDSLDAGQRDLRSGYTVRGRIITRSGRILSLLWRNLMKR